jgi:hypothetical protein
MDGVEHREQLDRAVAVAERGERDHGPDGSVRVLPAVLAHARRITLDVSRIGAAAVEGRSEQHDEPVPAAHEVSIDGVHGRAGPGWISAARDHGP